MVNIKEKVKETFTKENFKETFTKENFILALVIIFILFVLFRLYLKIPVDIREKYPPPPPSPSPLPSSPPPSPAAIEERSKKIEERNKKIEERNKEIEEEINETRRYYSIIIFFFTVSGILIGLNILRGETDEKFSFKKVMAAIVILCVMLILFKFVRFKDPNISYTTIDYIIVIFTFTVIARVLLVTDKDNKFGTKDYFKNTYTETRRKFKGKYEKFKGLDKEQRFEYFKYIINNGVFGFIILMIIHVLWIILVYTAPNLNEIQLSGDRSCNLPWLYYGVYPLVDYDVMNDINKYMFDIGKWLPDDIEDNPDFTCQPCPTNMTPNTDGGSGVRTSCRTCHPHEEWVSIDEIRNRRSQGVLRNDHRQLIQNDGMTIEDGMLNQSSYKTFANDHKDSFNQIIRETGMCLPLYDTSAGASSWMQTGNTNICSSYNSCMTQGPAYIELFWPKDINQGYHRVYPGQHFEIRDLDTPLSFVIPDNLIDPLLDKDGNPNTQRNCGVIDPAHPTDNKYHNPICDVTSLSSDHSLTIPLDTDENTNFCHLRIPLDHVPIPNTNSMMSLPPSDRVVRHGGNSSNSGPPCDDINQVAQDYLLYGVNNNISEQHITNNASLINNAPLTSRYVSRSGTNTVGDDWRDVYEIIYDNCYQSSTQGQCYMDNSICQTSNKTALPLVDLQANPSPVLTIPDASELGCKNITKVDSCTRDSNSNGSSCSALDIDHNGNIIEVSGVCRYARWLNNQWDIQDDNFALTSDHNYDIRCFPSPIDRNTYTGHTLSNPDKINYNNAIFTDVNKFENMCKRVPRFPASTPTPGANIFRYRISHSNACGLTSSQQAQYEAARQEQITSTILDTSGAFTQTVNGVPNQVTVDYEKYWDSWTNYPTATPSDISYSSTTTLDNPSVRLTS